ncbi:MAG: 2OG-Fe(II) oxygenase [Thermostichales cyanobacterium BF4_bins_65]
MVDGIERLMRVQVAVDQQFWLTLPELSQLLDLEPEKISPQGFSWRNFYCAPVPHAPGFWSITRPQSPPPPLPRITRQVSTSPEPGSLPSQFACIDDFLPAELVKELLDLTLQEQPHFVPTGVTTKEQNYRQSLFLPNFAQMPLCSKILDHIQRVMPEVMGILGIPNFRIAEIEAQLTAHNHGNYYKVHNDNGSPPTATRVFTYVYYFHRDPKGFEGGELRIFDTKIENNYYVGARSSTLVEPAHNRIVFFLSRYLHEVLEVRCPSGQFADSRFTVNGWIRSQSRLAV